VPEMAATLARAFALDPVAAYIFDDASRREERLRRFFLLQLRHNYLPRGEVFVVRAPTGESVAAALWLAPGAPAIGLVDALAHLGLVTLLRGRFPATRRLSLLLAARHPVEAHYYLGTIGTHPEHRRAGAASALLDRVLLRCDELAVPAYLECSAAANVTFYEHHGFAVTGVVDVPGGGPRLWLMRRPLTR